MKNSSSHKKDGVFVTLRFSLAAIIIVTLAGSSFQRNAVYHTFLSLWEDTASKNPQKSRIHNNLGNSYMLLGRYDEAVQEYKTAIALNKKSYEAYYNTAISFEKLGLEYEAVPYYSLFCKAAPIEYSEAIKIACERAARLAGITGTGRR